MSSPTLPPLKHLVDEYNRVFQKINLRLGNTKAGAVNAGNIRQFMVTLGGAWFLHDFIHVNEGDVAWALIPDPTMKNPGQKKPKHAWFNDKLWYMYKFVIGTGSEAAKEQRFAQWRTTGYYGSMCQYQARYPKANFPTLPPNPTMACPKVDKRLQKWKLQPVH